MAQYSRHGAWHSAPEGYGHGTVLQKAMVHGTVLQKAVNMMGGRCSRHMMPMAGKEQGSRREGGPTASLGEPPEGSRAAGVRQGSRGEAGAPQGSQK